jgi:hypothetical protein
MVHEAGPRGLPAEENPMARSPALNSEEARRKAEDRFRKAKQRDTEAQSAYEEQVKRQQAETAKTERLRALRLAKEAADAEAAQQAAEAKALAAEEAKKRRSLRPALARKSEEV